MAIKKFKVEATITKEFIISIDDEIYNDKYMKEFSEVIHEIDDLESVAKDLAFIQARYGNNMGFIEGYGNVTRNGKLIGHGNNKDIKPAPGLDIEIIDENDEYIFSVNEQL